MTQTLLGCLVVVTADRRKREIASSLERRGATVVHAPALTGVPLLDDRQLVAATREIIAHPPQIVVVTTGIGFRGWIEAVDAAGLLDDLSPVLRGARLIARGPKARGAIQQAGFEVEWVAESETAAEVRDYLLEQGVAGKLISVQHHGNGSDGLDEAFTAAGATVRSVVVYGMGPPADPQLHREWVHKAAAGGVDAVLFTSASGAHAWVQEAISAGLIDQLQQRITGDQLLLACVGPVTAAPLINAGLQACCPSRWRLGALIRLLDTHYSEAVPAVRTAGGVLQVRATAAVLNGQVLPLTPTGLEIVRLLAAVPGQVRSREEIIAALPGASATPRGVETAINRLREASGVPAFIRTVVKRGYALGLPQPAETGHIAG